MLLLFTFSMIISDQIREQPNIVQRKMIATNEYERLRELIRARLADCGWREQVTKLCKRALNEENMDDISVDDIVDKVTSQARALVPDTVKKELLQKIKTYLMEEAGLAPTKMIHMR